MTNNNRTDLDIAKDLEQLSSIVNESIERADNVLKKAQEIDEVKALIQEIYAARKSLESNQNTIQELETSVSDKLIKSQHINQELQAFEKLPQELEKLGINKNILDEAKEIISAVIEAEEQFKEANQSSRQSLESIKIRIQEIEKSVISKLDEARRIDKSLEGLKTLPQELEKLGINKNILDEVKEILYTVIESEEQFKEANQSSRQSFESVKIRIQEIENSVSSKLDKAQSIEKNLEDLKKLPQQFAKLGINEDILMEAKKIIGQIQEAKEDVKQTKNSFQEILQGIHEQAVQNSKQLTQKVIEISEQVDSKIQNFKKLINDYNNQITNAEAIYNQVVNQSEQSLQQSRQLNQTNLDLSEQVDSKIQDFKKLINDYNNQITNAEAIYNQVVNQSEQSLQQSRQLNQTNLDLSEQVDSKIQDFKKLINDYNNQITNAEAIYNQVVNQSEQSLQQSRQLNQTNLDLSEQVDSKIQDFKNLIIGYDYKVAKAEKINNKIVEKSDQLFGKLTQLNQRNFELSEQVSEQVKYLETLMITYDKKVDHGQIILNQLTAILEKTGGIYEIQQLLIEIRSARVQLKESTQEIINVRSLENYLQEFKKNRNHKQFRQWLWQELGIIGILIYFLNLITPKNSQRSR